MTSLEAVRSRFARNDGLPFADVLTEASILARIMHTLDPRESRGERNRMGSPNFRPSAIPEQPKQTALRRTPAKFPGRQEAQVSGAPRPPRAGKSCPSQSPTALQDRGCGWPRGCLALSVCSCRSGLRGVSFPVCL